MLTIPHGLFGFGFLKEYAFSASLQRASGSLLPFYALEQGLEVARTETARTHALNDLEEQCGAVNICSR